MNARQVSVSTVLAVLGFGREVHMRGAVIYAMGQSVKTE